MTNSNKLLIIYRMIRNVGSSALLAIALLLSVCGCSDSSLTTDELLVQAVNAGRRGDWQLCENHALTVLKRNPNDINGNLLRALAAEHLGKMDVALEAARVAAENAPEDFPSQYTFGRLLAQRPDAAKAAIQVLNRAIKLRPGNRNTLILLGQCSSRINSDDAVKYFNELPEKVRNLPEIQTHIAIYYIDRRDRFPGYRNEALNALGKAYKASPNNPGIVLNLALFIDYHLNNKAKAIGFYRRYLNLTQHNPELNHTRAQVQSRISELR